MVVRENTEGTYAGEGGWLRKGTPHEVATQGSVNTRMEWSAASGSPSNWRRRGPARNLTLVHKTNVLTFAGDLWQRTFDEVAEAEYPVVERRLQPRGRGLHLHGRAADALRRHRHRQSLRRHPH